MRNGFDTSDPGDLAVQDFQVAAGYLPGRTPHVWTKAQYDLQPARWRGGFCVADLQRDPVTMASEAVDYWQLLGAPEGTVIFLDMETLADAAWVNAFADHVHARHHSTVCYGSTSTLFRNPVRSGYFPADPTGVKHLYEHPHTVATQYGSTTVHPGGLTIDLDVFTDGLPLWDARPAPVTITPTWITDAVADLTGIATDALSVRTLIQQNAK